MKKKVVIFFVMVFFVLSIIPFINIISGMKIKAKKLYNVDFIIPYISKFLYPYGINIFSDEVVIGKNDWLFLGDNYAQTITLARSGVDLSYAEDASVKNNILYEWSRFFFSRGVKDFKILVGPNKSTVYSEFLPGWMKLSSLTKINMLIDATNNNYYVYPKKVLLTAKQNYVGRDLYYKTDTHWNGFGGWVAFDYFMNKLKKENLEIIYNQVFSLDEYSEINGGDLSGFLRLSGWLKDRQPSFNIFPDNEVHTECKVFYTNESYNCLDNSEIVSQQEPLLVVSKGAENNKKVLWLRDSFGTAISPYMARSFSNVIQVHYLNINKEQLIRLVEDFNPDYVFMTIVERNLDSGLPTDYPATHAGSGEIKPYSSQMVFYNDVKEKSEGFYIDGKDPYLVYRLDRGIDGAAADSVDVSLTCDNNKNDKKHIDIQVFWKGNINDDFSENNSGRFLIAQGTTEFQLGSIPNWVTAKNIQYLRLDIGQESIGRCNIFNVNNLVINKIQ